MITEKKVLVQSSKSIDVGLGVIRTEGGVPPICTASLMDFHESFRNVF